MLSNSLRSFAKKAAKVGAPKVTQTQLLIDGKFVNSASGQTFETFNPANEKSIAKV
jgi:hypothetical protein